MIPDPQKCCKHCGALLDENAQFCEDCGQIVAKPAVSQHQPPPQGAPQPPASSQNTASPSLPQTNLPAAPVSQKSSKTCLIAGIGLLVGMLCLSVAGIGGFFLYQQFAPPASVPLPSPTLAETNPNVPAETVLTVIKIATQSPLSGDLSAIGVDIKRGAELGLEQMGASLTAMGFKVELAPFDDRGNPDTGVANAKQIVSDPAILCGVGHYSSGVFIPSSEEYHDAGLAFVSPNTHPKVSTRGYLEVNRIVGRDDVQGVAGADFAIAQGMKSAFVVHDKTAYGEGIATLFRQEAEKKGMQVLGFEGTEEKANFKALLSPILAANPDVVYFGGMYDQAAVLFKQAREKGYRGMFLSDDGFDSSDAAKIGGQALLDGKGTYYSTVFGLASAYPGTTKFIADFKAKYNSDPQPFAAQGFDAAGICLKAIEAAAKDKNGQMPTRAEVALAIRALMDYAGITGTITFNSIGDPVVAKYFVLRVGSPNPANWSTNPVVEILDIAPPAP